MRYAKVLVGLALVLAFAGPVTGQSVSIDHVDGLNMAGGFDDGATLTFHFRITNPTAYDLSVLSNGFSFCRDGVEWESITLERNPNYVWDLDDGFPCFFDLGFFEVYESAGECDIVGVGAGTGQFGTGLPAGFDDIGWTVTVGPMDYTDFPPLLTIDTAFYNPAGYWLWGASGGIQIIPEWDGPYEYSGYVPPCRVVLDQDPIYLKDLADRVLTVYVMGCVPADIDLSTIRINGKVPPYTPPTFDGYTLTIEVFIFRMLSAYRPIMSSLQSTFTVEFDTYGGDHIVMEGPINVSVPAGDLNLDGETNQADLELLTKHIWHGGPAAVLEEMMDIDQNGRVDPMDISALADLTGN